MQNVARNVGTAAEGMTFNGENPVQRAVSATNPTILQSNAGVRTLHLCTPLLGKRNPGMPMKYFRCTQRLLP